MLQFFKYLTASLFIATFALAQSLNPPVVDVFNSIDPLEAYSYNKKIASEEFEGRLTGSPGYTKAANWAADEFEKMGLKPASELSGYLQPYNAPYSQIHSASMSLLLNSGDTLSLQPAQDFLPMGYCDDGYNKASLVFAGWGISAPDLEYDDYEGIDVKNKYIICFRGTPDRKDTSFKHYDQHRTRMQTAFNKGALGLFYIYPEVLANPNGDHIEGFMPAIISNKIGDKILSEKHLTVSELKSQLSDAKKPNSFPLNSKILFKVDAEYYPDATGYNIAGYIEGSDPELKNECVVIGGHFDHCGRIADYVFHGANDNGSGSAVVMTIAEAYSRLPEHPKRSVLFVLFGGEEKGLRGSSYFADHFPDDFSKIDAMFNFDMNGEGEGTNYGYSLQDNMFKETLLKADEYVGTFRRSFEIKDVGVRSSDYAPFFQKGAIVAAFFSNGPHLHYHQTGDTIYRINPDMLGDIAKVGFLSSYFWADR